MELVEEIVKLANRVSSNIELPSDKSLKLLAPNKTKEKVLQPLKFARDLSLIKESKTNRNEYTTNSWSNS